VQGLATQLAMPSTGGSNGKNSLVSKDFDKEESRSLGSREGTERGKPAAYITAVVLVSIDLPFL
jgi:hypothetical protein